MKLEDYPRMLTEGEYEGALLIGLEASRLGQFMEMPVYYDVENGSLVTPGHIRKVGERSVELGEFDLEREMIPVELPEYIAETLFVDLTPFGQTLAAIHWQRKNMP